MANDKPGRLTDPKQIVAIIAAITALPVARVRVVVMKRLSDPEQIRIHKAREVLKSRLMRNDLMSSNAVAARAALGRAEERADKSYAKKAMAHRAAREARVAQILHRPEGIEEA